MKLHDVPVGDTVPVNSPYSAAGPQLPYHTGGFVLVRAALHGGSVWQDLSLLNATVGMEFIAVMLYYPDSLLLCRQRFSVFLLLGIWGDECQLLVHHPQVNLSLWINAIMGSTPNTFDYTPEFMCWLSRRAAITPRNPSCSHPVSLGACMAIPSMTGTSTQYHRYDVKQSF